MPIFNSHVSLPEGNPMNYRTVYCPYIHPGFAFFKRPGRRLELKLEQLHGLGEGRGYRESEPSGELQRGN